MKTNIAIIAVSFCCHCLFGQSFAHIGCQQADAEILSFLDSMQITSYMLGVFQDTVPPAGVSGLDDIWDGKGYLYFVKENTPPYTDRYLYLIVGEDGGLRRFYGTGPSLAGNWRLFTTDKPFSEEDLFDLGGISRPVLSGDRAGERNYAIRINGGKNDKENHPRYWNNCAAVYSVLTGIYGFDKNNIYVLMSDGTSPGIDTYEIVGDPEAGRFGSFCRPCSSDPDLDGDGVDDVRFSATKENITLVFDSLSEKMTEDDNLFIFTTDHGGADSVNDTYVLSLWKGTTADSEFFSREIAKIRCGTVNIVMAQCNSGGAFPRRMHPVGSLRPPVKQPTSSYNRNSVYDEFVYHWVSAIVGETPEGMPVDADSNDDGYISMEEAYLYALRNDSKPEISQYLSNPENLGTFLDLSGLDACTQTTVANQEIATDRELEDCSIVIRNTSVKDGTKLILNYGLHVSVEAGFEMEEGAELEISPSGR